MSYKHAHTQRVATCNVSHLYGLRGAVYRKSSNISMLEISLINWDPLSLESNPSWWCIIHNIHADKTSFFPSALSTKGTWNFWVSLWSNVKYNFFPQLFAYLNSWSEQRQTAHSLTFFSLHSIFHFEIEKSCAPLCKCSFHCSFSFRITLTFPHNIWPEESYWNRYRN